MYSDLWSRDGIYPLIDLNHTSVLLGWLGVGLVFRASMATLCSMENFTPCITATFSSCDFASSSNCEVATTTAAVAGITAQKRGDDAPPRYGFGGAYHSQFSGMPDTVVRRMVLLPRPDEMPAWRRCAARKAAEDRHFDPDKLHRASLPTETAMYAHALRYIPPASPLPLPSSLTIPPPPQPSSTSSVFKRSMPLNGALCSRLDEGVAVDLTGILYSAMYVECLSAGLTSVHCAPLVTALSPALSFLEHSRSARDALCGAYRRSLIYSPYTSVVLSGRVLRHVGNLFDGGVSETRLRLSNIIRKLRTLFFNHPVLQIHCRLFFNDYIKWIDSVTDEVLGRLAADVVDITHSRTIPFDLEWEWRCVDYGDADSVERLPPCPRSIDDAPAVNIPLHMDANDNFQFDSNVNIEYNVCGKDDNDCNVDGIPEEEDFHLNQVRPGSYESPGYACIYTKFQSNDISKPVLSKTNWVPKGSSLASSYDSCTDYINSRRSSDDCTPPSIRAKWSKKA